MRITFGKVDRIFIIHEGSRYLVLFGPKQLMLFTKRLDTLLIKKWYYICYFS